VTLDAGSILSHIPAMVTNIAADIEFKQSLASSIRERMKRDNISISALAQRMGTGRTAVRRILDKKNTSITFRSMSRAARAVGLKITLEAEPMSPEELGELARRLPECKTDAEFNELKEQLIKGFYGEV